MALSLSGDDEEYESESEQVRVATLLFYYISLFLRILSRCAVRKKVLCGRFFSAVASG